MEVMKIGLNVVKNLKS